MTIATLKKIGNTEGMLFGDLETPVHLLPRSAL